MSLMKLAFIIKPFSKRAFSYLGLKGFESPLGLGFNHNSWNLAYQGSFIDTPHD